MQIVPVGLELQASCFMTDAGKNRPIGDSRLFKGLKENSGSISSSALMDLSTDINKSCGLCSADENYIVHRVCTVFLHTLELRVEHGCSTQASGGPCL